MTLAVLFGGSMVAAGRTKPPAPRPADAAVRVPGTSLSAEDEAPHHENGEVLWHAVARLWGR